MILVPVEAIKNSKNAVVNDMPIVVKDIEIVNISGLHARPSAFFAKEASKFRSEIFVELGEMKVNGKSIMGLITLEASFGKILHVTCDGDDAEDQMKAVEWVVKNFVVGE